MVGSSALPAVTSAATVGDAAGRAGCTSTGLPHTSQALPSAAPPSAALPSAALPSNSRILDSFR